MSGDDGSWSIEVPVGATVLDVNTYTAPGRYFARYEGVIEVVDSRTIEIVVEPGCVVSGTLVGRWAEAAGEGDLSLYVEHHEAPNRWAGQRSANVKFETAGFELRSVGADSYSATLRRSNEDLSGPIPFDVPAGFLEGAAIRVTLDFP